MTVRKCIRTPHREKTVKIALYYSPGACSLASHLVLEEIGRPYDTIEVNLRRGEHLKPEYRKQYRVPDEV